jgi:hypothetical protein
MTRSRAMQRRLRRLLFKARRSARRFLRSRAAPRAAAVSAILIAAFIVGAWVVVPYAVGSVLARWAAEAPGRTAHAARIGVNPFRMRVTLEDPTFAVPAGEWGASRLVLDFDFRTLLGSALVFDSIEVHSPSVRLGGDSRNPAAVESFVPARALRVARLNVTGGRIEWPGASGDPHHIDGIALRATSLDTEAESAARFELDADEVAGGVVQIEGEVFWVRRAGSGRVSANDVDAAELGRWLFGTEPASGTLSVDGSFQWLDGGVALRAVTLDMIGASINTASDSIGAAIVEAAGDAEWRDARFSMTASVALDGVSVSAAGAQWLAAERIEATSARLAGQRIDGAAALSSASADALLLTAPVASIALGGAPAAADSRRRPLSAAIAMITSPFDAGEPPSSALQVSLLEVRGGTFDLFDESAERPATFKLSEVNGRVERAERARSLIADLRARIADAGEGSLLLHADLADEPRFEVELEIAGVPAALLAVHAERLGGVAIDAGEIGAELDYVLSSEGLVGSARLSARRLEARSVADDDRFPLALALLEDPQGDAETDVAFDAPGRGRLLDVLAAAIAARVDEVAATPFDALGAAVGTDAEVLAAVEFSPGDAAPAEAGRETIAALAEALRARPRVGLRVRGSADRTFDRAALATSQVELHVTLATAGPVVVARPQPIDFDSPRHRDILDEFAGERLSRERRETIASYFTRTEGGDVVDAEKSDYYRTLFHALAENEAIPDGGLERLGRFRARSIADALMGHGIDPARIETAPPALIETDGAADDSAVRVRLEAVVPAAPQETIGAGQSTLSMP